MMQRAIFRVVRAGCGAGAIALACTAARDSTELDGGALSDAACPCKTCEPGEVRCSGSMLQHCNARGTGFDTVDVCFDLGGFGRPPRRDPALCDAAHDQCLLCVPDSSRCVEDIVETDTTDPQCSTNSLAQTATIARCSSDGMSEAQSSCGGSLGAYCRGRGSKDESVPDAECFAECNTAFDCDIGAPACIYTCGQGYCSYTCCVE